MISKILNCFSGEGRGKNNSYILKMNPIEKKRWGNEKFRILIKVFLWEGNGIEGLKNLALLFRVGESWKKEGHQFFGSPWKNSAQPYPGDCSKLGP